MGHEGSYDFYGMSKRVIRGHNGSLNTLGSPKEVSTGSNDSSKIYKILREDL